jgi:hypothetical protein
MLAAAALDDLELRLSCALKVMFITDGQLQQPVAAALSPAPPAASSGCAEAQAAPIRPPAQAAPIRPPAQAAPIHPPAPTATIHPPAPAEIVLSQAPDASGFHRRNVTDFFSILAGRHDADQGRLAFWSRYLQQVTWTRLVLGADTLALQHDDAGMRDLVARQHGAHAGVTKAQDQDALMMLINGHLIVEFAKLPDAAYIYRTAGIKFDCHAGLYSGDMEDLKYGYREFGHRDGKVRRIMHISGWQQDAAAQLKRIAIVPDIPVAQCNSTVTRQPVAPTFTMQARLPVRAWMQAVPAPLPVTAALAIAPHELAPAGAKFTMGRLVALVQQFDKASIDDQRASADGCLWVADPVRRPLLASALMELGFRWNSARVAWYYPQRLKTAWPDAACEKIRFTAWRARGTATFG